MIRQELGLAPGTVITIEHLMTLVQTLAGRIRQAGQINQQLAQSHRELENSYLEQSQALVKLVNTLKPVA